MEKGSRRHCTGGGLSDRLSRRKRRRKVTNGQQYICENGSVRGNCNSSFVVREKERKKLGIFHIFPLKHLKPQTAKSL